MLAARLAAAAEAQRLADAEQGEGETLHPSSKMV